jgi:hypothetical protein
MMMVVMVVVVVVVVVPFGSSHNNIGLCPEKDPYGNFCQEQCRMLP